MFLQYVLNNFKRILHYVGSETQKPPVPGEQSRVKTRILDDIPMEDRSCYYLKWQDKMGEVK